MPSYGFGLKSQRRNIEDFLPKVSRLKAAQAAPPHLPANWMDLARTTTDPNQWFGLKRLYQQQPGRSDEDAYHAALYGNPLARTFDTASGGGHRGLLGRVKQAARTTPAFSQPGRVAMAKIAAFVLGAQALGTATAGAGAGGGAAAGTGGGLTASQAAAAGVDPFLAGGGVAGAGGAAAAAGGGASLGADGFAGIGPWMSEAAGPSAAAAPWWQSTLGKTGIKLGANFLTNKFLGGKTTEESQLSKLSRAPYESSDIQRFLPPELRAGAIGPALESGMSGIAELLRNPGGLSPTVSDAIRARLSEESQSIAQNFRGIGANQAGAAARGNQPMSIKGALQSALDVAQERAQRGARNEALTQSDTLRREDLGQAFKILDAILQFISSGRGQSIPGLARAADQSGNRQAAQLASIASLLSSGASQGG